jgi:multicomponent Na+:H+ antiporter subunit F
MSDWSAVVALFLLGNMVAGFARVWRGPLPADRMLAAQLFGTTGVAIMVLLADALARPALRDVALVLALLAAMAVVVFVCRVWVAPGAAVEGGPSRGASGERTSDNGGSVNFSRRRSDGQRPLKRPILFGTVTRMAWSAAW